ncbi:FhaA domain-containing protein [Acetonema longum]|uniref:FHA domain containing protein n=1 Tax=Acetonema longum DSM 6540 TaxID=1009370 RepID=F7NLE8_9FIRM|nr:DUF3662 and FHA domain-containing protein [Acetonema longum]EGO63253.1 FHA domain containing protein [Acetonema longum DSM 6540]
MKLNRFDKLNLNQLENFFEKHIEGFFEKKLSSELQPVEIAKHMARSMDNAKMVGVSNLYVPNSYTVYLSQVDFERLSPYISELRQELHQYLAEYSRKKNYTFAGQLKMEVALDPVLSLGQCRIENQFAEPEPTTEPPAPEEADNDFSDTKVFPKLSVAEPNRQVVIAGLLTVIDGLDKGLFADIARQRVNIGRLESNELPLTDMNASRLHAYIILEEGKHVLNDAKSLNGTYINEHRIVRKVLASGDRIKLGNTIILYEVK